MSLFINAGKEIFNVEEVNCFLLAQLLLCVKKIYLNKQYNV